MSELDREKQSRPSATRVSLQQYSFSGSPTPSPKRRSTQTPTPAAALIRSKPNTTSSSTMPTSITSGSSLPSAFDQMKKRKREPSTTTSSSNKKTSPSRYAHVPNLLVDTLQPNLICVFIGVNPGIKTATSGHAYAHPSNLFWKLLHSSGCTPRLCKPAEDRDLPQLYALGNTNIVARATKDASELTKGEMDDGVAVLEEKIRRWRPEAVCIVGKGIWESVWRVRHGRAIKKEQFRYGWQEDAERMGVIKARDGKEGWKGARTFVGTTTSALAASMSLHEKEEIWKVLGEWVARKRGERGIPHEGGVREEPVPAKQEEGDDDNDNGHNEKA